jgi:hypothetical protein
LELITSLFFRPKEKTFVACKRGFSHGRTAVGRFHEKTTTRLRQQAGRGPTPPMSNDTTFDKKTIAQILDAHDAECVDDLPLPVRNNIREGPDAEIDPFAFFRSRGEDADEPSDVHVHVHVDGGDD